MYDISDLVDERTRTALLAWILSHGVHSRRGANQDHTVSNHNNESYRMARVEAPVSKQNAAERGRNVYVGGGLREVGTHGVARNWRRL